MGGRTMAEIRRRTELILEFWRKTGGEVITRKSKRKMNDRIYSQVYYEYLTPKGQRMRSWKQCMKYLGLKKESLTDILPGSMQSIQSSPSAGRKYLHKSPLEPQVPLGSTGNEGSEDLGDPGSEGNGDQKDQGFSTPTGGNLHKSSSPSGSNVSSDDFKDEGSAYERRASKSAEGCQFVLGNRRTLETKEKETQTSSASLNAEIYTFTPGRVDEIGEGVTSGPSTRKKKLQTKRKIRRSPPSAPTELGKSSEAPTNLEVESSEEFMGRPKHHTCNRVSEPLITKACGENITSTKKKEPEADIIYNHDADISDDSHIEKAKERTSDHSKLSAPIQIDEDSSCDPNTNAYLRKVFEEVMKTKTKTNCKAVVMFI